MFWDFFLRTGFLNHIRITTAMTIAIPKNTDKIIMAISFVRLGSNTDDIFEFCEATSVFFDWALVRVSPYATEFFGMINIIKRNVVKIV